MADQAYLAENSPAMCHKVSEACNGVLSRCRPLTPTMHGRMAGADTLYRLALPLS
jgi:hypothetical protein